jgi:molybdopterin molybdotransferase
MAVATSSWAAARGNAATAAAAVAPRELPLELAAGAVLAADVVARTDLPPADASAMDGWAVAGPGPWRVRGEVLAGEVPPPLAPGDAVTIATGARLPAGADGVLRAEHGKLAGGDLVATDPRDPARDVRRAGRECRAGDVVLAAGSRLTPAAIGLLAAAGADVVSVRRATVDVLVLGDELLTAGPARDGRIRDALGPMLSAWLPALGLSVVTRRHLPDSFPALASAMSASTADLTVTTGSTAHGPVDHLHRVLASLGAELVIDGVAVRPGHPQLLAVRTDGRPIVGLPGNPLAAATALLTLVVPLVEALHAAASPPRRTVTLTEDVPAGEEATRLVPVRDGRPVLFAGPAMLRGLAVADGVAVVPPGGVRAGAEVELLALPL